MRKQLNFNQRQKIAELLQNGKSFKEIAEVLGVANSTIVREINRNVGDDGVYNPDLAEQKRRLRRKYRFLSPVALAQISPDVKEEIDKVSIYESPLVRRRLLIIEKYIKTYGPLIEKKLITPNASMHALANEFYMSSSAIYYLLRREGIYKDAEHPLCIPSE